MPPYNVQSLQLQATNDPIGLQFHLATTVSLHPDVQLDDDVIVQDLGYGTFNFVSAGPRLRDGQLNDVTLCEIHRQ